MEENNEKETEVVTEEQPQVKTAAEYEEEIARLKAANSKASADVSKYKNELRARMSSDEQAEAERKERDARIAEELAGYKERERISTNTARLMAAGYDAQTAEIMAKNLSENVTDDFFEGQRVYLENLKMAFESASLTNQPEITAGVPLSSRQLEDKKFRGWFGLK